MLARTRRTFHTLPRLMRVGLGITVLGAAIDLGYHFGTSVSGMGHSPIALASHVVTLVGMIVTMLGLIGAAFTRRPAGTTPPPKGENE